MYWIAVRPGPDAASISASGAPVLDGRAALHALGGWALQYTPKVAQLNDALLLELSGSARLWGGWAALLRHIFESNKPLADVLCARGATSLIAYARLQDKALARTVADDLPLHTLVAARPHLATLLRLGCKQWGQLRALPRDGVARRFGAALLAALDRAYGLQPEIYPWLAAPEVFEARLELDAAIETAPALLFGVRRLLKQLQRWLQLRQRGVLALELCWQMDPRRNTATQGQLVLRSAEPGIDTAHLLRLASEQLAQVNLSAPVHTLCLRTLETQKLALESAALLPDARRPGDSLQCLLERLAARLGAQQVLQMQPCADYRPEKMQRWQPALSATQLVATREDNTKAIAPKGIKNAALYPSWLLATPRQLAVRRSRPYYLGALTLVAGPQRLESAWWDAGDCALRDYFVARSEQAGLLWIYRQRLLPQAASAADAGPSWYLHGFFA